MPFFVHLKGCMGSMSCKIFSFIRSSNVRTSKVSQDLQTGQSSASGLHRVGNRNRPLRYNRHLNENLTQCDQCTRGENRKILNMLLSKLNTICLLMFVVSAQSSLFMNPLKRTFSTGTKKSCKHAICTKKSTREHGMVLLLLKSRNFSKT